MMGRKKITKMSDVRCYMTYNGRLVQYQHILKKKTCQKTNENSESMAFARVKKTSLNPMETLQCKCLRVKKYGC